MDYTIIGKVVAGAELQPIANLSVVVSYRSHGQLLKDGKTTTDANGGFKLVFSDALLADATPNDPVEASFQVFHGNQTLESQGGIPRLAPQDQQVAITLGQSPQNADSEYAVSGKVANRTRAGVGGLRIDIVDKNIGGVFVLADAETDDSGAYRATFPVAAVTQRGKKQPDFQALAYASKTPLGESEVRYNASMRETCRALLQRWSGRSGPCSGSYSADSVVGS